MNDVFFVEGRPVEIIRSDESAKTTPYAVCKFCIFEHNYLHTREGIGSRQLNSENWEYGRMPKGQVLLYDTCPHHEKHGADWCTSERDLVKALDMLPIFGVSAN